MLKYDLGKCAYTLIAKGLLYNLLSHFVDITHISPYVTRLWIFLDVVVSALTTYSLPPHVFGQVRTYICNISHTQRERIRVHSDTCL